MEEIRRRFLINLLKVFDLVLVTLSFGVATLLAAYSDNRESIAEFLSIRVKLSNCVIFVAFLLAWHLLLRSYGLYKTKRIPTRETDILDAMKAIALSTGCLGGGRGAVSYQAGDAAFPGPLLVLRNGPGDGFTRCSSRDA